MTVSALSAGPLRLKSVESSGGYPTSARGREGLMRAHSGSAGGCPKRRARDAILTRREAARRVRLARRRGERVVFTSGCFDLLHVGHLRSLEEARSLGDRLLVAVNRDATVRRLKGADRPILREAQRAEMLAGLACVDWVTFFAEATPRALLGQVMPDIYAKGGDWSLRELCARDLPVGAPIEVHRLRQIPGVRTTSLVEKIRR
ncbi:MAG: adenylyltransferase/cytidyltransferase family protein [Myxococcales bacterium]|nr:adenylyltransferase/cytidyltransferase family protein [Myxococcales bacterium]